MKRKATNMDIADSIVVPARTSLCTRIPSSTKPGLISRNLTALCNLYSLSNPASTNQRTLSSPRPAASPTVLLAFSLKTKLLELSRSSAKWTHLSRSSLSSAKCANTSSPKSWTLTSKVTLKPSNSGFPLPNTRFTLL